MQMVLRAGTRVFQQKPQLKPAPQPSQPQPELSSAKAAQKMPLAQKPSRLPVPSAQAPELNLLTTDLLPFTDLPPATPPPPPKAKKKPPNQLQSLLQSVNQLWHRLHQHQSVASEANKNSDQIRQLELSVGHLKLELVRVPDQVRASLQKDLANLKFDLTLEALRNAEALSQMRLTLDRWDKSSNVSRIKMDNLGASVEILHRRIDHSRQMTDAEQNRTQQRQRHWLGLLTLLTCALLAGCLLLNHRQLSIQDQFQKNLYPPDPAAGLQRAFQLKHREQELIWENLLAQQHSLSNLTAGQIQWQELVDQSRTQILNRITTQEQRLTTLQWSNLVQLKAQQDQIQEDLRRWVLAVGSHLLELEGQTNRSRNADRNPQ
jgi:hypothetical protein